MKKISERAVVRRSSLSLGRNNLRARVTARGPRGLSVEVGDRAGEFVALGVEVDAAGFDVLDLALSDFVDAFGEADVTDFFR